MSQKLNPRANLKYLVHTITQVLDSGKIGDERISQDNWLQLIELLAIVVGAKPMQGSVVNIPKLKPRGRSAGVNFDKLLKAEERRRKLVQAADAEGFQLVPYKAGTTEAVAEQAEGEQK